MLPISVVVYRDANFQREIQDGFRAAKLERRSAICFGGFNGSIERSARFQISYLDGELASRSLADPSVLLFLLRFLSLSLILLKLLRFWIRVSESEPLRGDTLRVQCHKS